jgi:hypothetical protein
MFKNLKLNTKLLLVALVFSFPLGVLLNLLVKTYNYKIDFNQWEIYGDLYQRPLEGLLKTVGDHKFLARQYLAGKTTARKEALQALEAEIDKHFEDLVKADKLYGEPLQFTDKGLALRKREHAKASILHSEWNELKGARESLDAADSDQKHLHLAADLRTMITHNGDISNLILDPDLDTYYNMDVTLLALPQTQDRLAGILQDGLDILKARGSSLSDQDRIQFGTWAALLREADMNRVVASQETAINEDQNFLGVSNSFQSRVPPALQEYKAKTEAFLKVLDSLSSGEEVSADKYVSAAQTARQASFDLWDVVVVEQDILIARRLLFYTHGRIKVVGLAVLALLIAFTIVSLIKKSVLEPWGIMQETIKAQASMDFSKKLDIVRDDEIGQMALGINKVGETMKNALGTISRSSGALNHLSQQWAPKSSALLKDNRSAESESLVKSVKDVGVNAENLEKLARKFKV